MSSRSEFAFTYIPRQNLLLCKGIPGRELIILKMIKRTSFNGRILFSVIISQSSLSYILCKDITWTWWRWPYDAYTNSRGPPYPKYQQRRSNNVIVKIVKRNQPQYTQKCCDPETKCKFAPNFPLPSSIFGPFERTNGQAVNSKIWEIENETDDREESAQYK